MKPTLFVCLLLCAAPLLGQSKTIPVGRQPQDARILPRGPRQQRALRNERVGTSRLTSAQSSGLDFAPVVNYGTGGVLAWSVAVADVNRDGKPDIVVANMSSNTVSVLLGNGDGTFQAAITYDSGFEPISVAVADVNGDGNPDLIVTNQRCGSGCDGGSEACC